MLAYAVRDSTVRAHWRATGDERAGSIVLVTPSLSDPDLAASLAADLAADLGTPSDPKGGGVTSGDSAGRDRAGSPAPEGGIDSFDWTLDDDSLFVAFATSLG